MFCDEEQATSGKRTPKKSYKEKSTLKVLEKNKGGVGNREIGLRFAYFIIA